MSTVLILLGAPGSGKGTQAVRLGAEYGLVHVSTGDLLRENVERGTELGKEARAFMDGGELVPDRLALDVLFDRVAAADCADGYVLDGFPRTLAQAEALQDRLGEGTAVHVIRLSVSDETIVARAVGRLICRGCGRVSHETFSPPKVEGVCDACGAAELHKRPDDAPEVVRARLRVYRELTAPLVGFYEARGALVNVNGEGSPDEVFQRLLGVIRAEGRVKG